MLDEDEVAAFDEWKADKITHSQDLSVSAYNREMESVALAWEAGHRAAANGVKFEDNHNRKPGMRGERTTKKITTRVESDDEE